MNVERRSDGGDTSCPRFREAISARLDGEDPGMPDDVIDAHLVRCADCTHFAEVARWQHRRSRVRAAAPVPDLTGEILFRLASIPPPKTGRAAASQARRRVAAIAAAVVVVVAAGFAGGGLLASHSGPGGGTGSGVTVHQEAGPSQTSSRYPGATVMGVGVPKPAVQLTDTAGKPYDLAAETARRVTLVYFGYTHCPDLCPINMALTAAALRDLSPAQRRRIAVVFITTDPARDHPKVIRAWLNRFDPAFVGLTGSVASIHAAEVQVQMPLSYADPAPSSADRAPSSGRTAPVTETGQHYEVVHAGYTLLYAPDGRANLTVDDSARPDQFAATLARLLAHGFQEPR